MAMLGETFDFDKNLSAVCEKTVCALYESLSCKALTVCNTKCSVQTTAIQTSCLHVVILCNSISVMQIIRRQSGSGPLLHVPKFRLL